MHMPLMGKKIGKDIAPKNKNSGVGKTFPRFPNGYGFSPRLVSPLVFPKSQRPKLASQFLGIFEVILNPNSVKSFSQ